MPIKTIGGKVILKGGKPSCTCCCPVCDPASVTVYFEWAYTDPDPPHGTITQYGSFTIDLLLAYDAEFGGCASATIPSGEFDIEAEGNYTVAVWFSPEGKWIINIGATTTEEIETFSDPCDPAGSWLVVALPVTLIGGTLTISTTPLP